MKIIPTENPQTINITRLVDEQRIGRFGLGINLISFLVMFSDGYVPAAYAAPWNVRQWHMNRAVMGPVFSASLFGMLFGAQILGNLGDRFRRKGAIPLRCLLYGIARPATTDRAAIYLRNWPRRIAAESDFIPATFSDLSSSAHSSDIIIP
jgi:MFS transporter, AAHS family, 4-hydroxybenzoate transporter